MRTLAYLKKTFLENLREWKVLSFALVFAPAFVYMMYGYFGAAAAPPIASSSSITTRDPAADGSASESAALVRGLAGGQASRRQSGVHDRRSRRSGEAARARSKSATRTSRGDPRGLHRSRARVWRRQERSTGAAR